MLIKRLTLKKILSFNEATVELGPLNVLIGPNAVGKSNLIEVIGLLQAAPSSLAAAILRGGGVRQLIWLGDPVPSPIATIGCQIDLRQRHADEASFESRSQRMARTVHPRPALAKGRNRWRPLVKVCRANDGILVSRG